MVPPGCGCPFEVAAADREDVEPTQNQFWLVDVIRGDPSEAHW